MGVNKVVFNTVNGEQTLVDLTNDSVTPETLAEGVTAHDASGEDIVGTMPTTTVLYTEQTLTDAQKAQARENIGAQEDGAVKSVNGIAPDENGNVEIEAGSGVTSWNDLTDKPFGEVGGDTLTWDGNTEGRAIINVTDGFIEAAHVSDAVPTMDDLANGCTVSFPDDNLAGFTGGVIDSSDIFQIDGIGVIVGMVAVIVNEPNDDFPRAGTYLAYNMYEEDISKATYVDALTIPGYTGFPVTKKLDAKYLPGAVVLYTDGTYLYNSEDVSNADNRITMEELTATTLSGRAMYLTSMGLYYPFACIVLDGSYGECRISMNGVDFSVYTAEYTGS